MPYTKTLKEQLLNATLSGVQQIERFACYRIWHWTKEATEAVMTVSRLLDLFLPIPFLQPLLEFVHDNELSLGLCCAVTTITLAIGETQALTRVFSRILG